MSANRYAIVTVVEGESPTDAYNALTRGTELADEVKYVGAPLRVVRMDGDAEENPEYGELLAPNPEGDWLGLSVDERQAKLRPDRE